MQVHYHFYYFTFHFLLRILCEKEKRYVRSWCLMRKLRPRRDKSLLYSDYWRFLKKKSEVFLVFWLLRQNSIFIQGAGRMGEMGESNDWLSYFLGMFIFFNLCLDPWNSRIKPLGGRQISELGPKIPAPLHTLCTILSLWCDRTPESH